MVERIDIQDTNIERLEKNHNTRKKGDDKERGERRLSGGGGGVLRIS